MKRRSVTGNRGFPLVLALLFALAATPLAAQQASAPAPHAAVGATFASPPARTATAGPRVDTGWRPVKPAFRSEMMASSGSDSHTFTVSTIVLVLVVVVVLLLVLR